jgi:thiol-disulfide isomerase/thioredoxin
LIHFVLYSRAYCHLCDDMLQALHALSTEYQFSAEVIDVDADEMLVAQFDELVPVLFGGKPGIETVRLCHYFLDEVKVREFLASA